MRYAELTVLEPAGDVGEPVVRYGDLKVVMGPGLGTQKQVERPAGRHAPRQVKSFEPVDHHLRRPRLPCIETGHHTESLASVGRQAMASMVGIVANQRS